MVRYLFLCWCVLWSLYSQAQGVRVATSDWAVAETLQAMNHPPVAVGDKRAYQHWVVEPALSAATVDSGVRLQPNRELLSQLRLKMFINTPFYRMINQQLTPIAPVYQVAFSHDDGYSWSSVTQATQQIADLIGDRAAAPALIQTTQSALAADKQRLYQLNTRQPPLLIVQFIDGRHVRIYARNSLYQLALDALQLRNAWPEKGNSWGFVSVPLTALTQLAPDTRLVVVQPYPHYVAHEVQHSALWQRLSFMQTNHYLILPASWSSGGLPSVARFGHQLTEALVHDQGTAW
ncbi:ABC transporter substrate-binding protein [Neisseriaceae bacterium ESL0693]|nr:ABC transporter substrate-binding protein [Neisseriaceae bacterium ESL0693]